MSSKELRKFMKNCGLLPSGPSGSSSVNTTKEESDRRKKRKAIVRTSAIEVEDQENF